MVTTPPFLQHLLCTWLCVPSVIQRCEDGTAGTTISQPASSGSAKLSGVTLLIKRRDGA